jgi:uncharacterized protein YmfQ (DUF2313 family)
MAFEDVYGEVESTSYDVGVVDEINESYVQPLLQLLPQGPIWEYESGDDFYELLRALSYPLFRIEQRGLDLIEEMDPRTTYELLPDWERVLDLPGSNPSPASTIAERRSAIHARLLGFGDPTIDFYEGVAEGLEYGATVAHKQYNTFVPGSRSGDPLTNHEWAYSWNLITHSGSNDDLLKWTIEQTVPAHTKLNYSIFDWYNASSGNGFFPGNYIWAAAYGEGTLGPRFVVGGASGKISTSREGRVWTAIAPISANTIYTMIWAEGLSLFICAGSGGMLYTSPNGTTWTVRTSQFGASDIRYLAYDETIGMAIAVGDAGKLSSSPDGLTWTARTSQFGADTIWRVMSNNALFIATGANGKISTSTNGTAWTARTSGASTIVWDVAWRDPTNTWDSATERFVTIGRTDPIFCVSDNGTAWFTIDPPSGTDVLLSIVYGNGVFLAAGTVNGDSGVVLYSTDGNVWEVVRVTDDVLPGYSVELRFGNGLFLFTDTGGNCAVSPDGKNWAFSEDATLVSNPVVSGYLGDDTSGVFIVAGPSGYLYTAFMATNEAAVGHHLVSQEGPTTSDLNSVTVDDTGLFCTAGNAIGGDVYIATTLDGITWTRITTTASAAVNLEDVHFDIGTRVWIAVGAGDGSDAMILTSGNTLTWTEQTNPKNIGLNAIECYSGLWVAVGAFDGGDSYLITSSDSGVTWTERTTTGTTGYLSGVAHNGSGKWVAVGENGAVLTSNDGLSWTLQTAPTGSDLLDVIYEATDDAWYAVGSTTGLILVSFNDGVTWTNLGLPAVQFQSILETEDTELLAGGPLVYGSRGGLDWSVRRNPNLTSADVYGMAYFNNLLICVGPVTPSTTKAYVLTSRKESELFDA